MALCQQTGLWCGLIAIVLTSWMLPVNGHGFMLEPPSRTSAWRVGFQTPTDVDDNGHNCGGLSVQYITNGGKCGICGDPFNAVIKPTEAPGGRFATGTIVRTYQAGQTIMASIVISANHRGFFEFKLCPNNNVFQDPTQECFERYPIKTIDGNTRFYLTTDAKDKFDIQLRLPDEISCSQCIIQWTYTAGNNWGFCGNGTGANGCGPQEMFRACADVAIARLDSTTHHHPLTITHHPMTTTTTSTTTTSATTTTATTPVPTTTTTTTTQPTTVTTSQSVFPTPSITTSTTTVSSTQKFTCPLPWGLFPNPVDCRSFYSCGNGNSYLMICPLGLHYNPLLSVCDWPADSNCVSSG